ncbi:MAG TPA: hypothetical protein VIF60_23930 [Burkholderiaceae bacterium]
MALNGQCGFIGASIDAGGKFVAANAGDRCGVAATDMQPFGDLDKNKIANILAEVSVDGFEAVQGNAKKTEFFGLISWPCQEIGNFRLQIDSRKQSGQGINVARL